MKPIKGWVVIGPDGDSMLDTFRPGKKSFSMWAVINEECENAYIEESNYGKHRAWRYFYNRGYRCLRVTLRGD